MKKIEVNLGIGINMFFPEPVTIVIEDEVNDESHALDRVMNNDIKTI